MNELVNINMGIDSMAKSYLDMKSQGVTLNMNHGKKHFPENEVYHRVGNIPSIELKRYPLKDGTFAEEFVQAVIKTGDGRRLYFLGLNAGSKNIIWPLTKMRSKISEQMGSKTN